MIYREPVTQPQPERRKKSLWWRVLLAALGFYLAGVVLMVFTGNPNLFPTVVMLGSFMVPATYVVFFYERRHWSEHNLPATALSFIYGGLVAVLVVSVLEQIFIQSLTFTSAFLVGLIEEAAKILGIVIIARRLDHDSQLDGMVLGAAAGMGFAALESTGYAFTAFLSSGGNVSQAVFVTLVRGLLSPLGHGTWTAILAGVLFREARAGRFHINRRVIGAYLTVAGLHGLWDGLPLLISAVVGSGPDVMIGQVTVGLLGIYILWRNWRQAQRLDSDRQFVNAEMLAQTSE